MSFATNTYLPLVARFGLDASLTKCLPMKQWEKHTVIHLALHVGSGEWAQVLRLAKKALPWWSHLPAPQQCHMHFIGLRKQGYKLVSTTPLCLFLVSSSCYFYFFFFPSLVLYLLRKPDSLSRRVVYSVACWFTPVLLPLFLWPLTFP